ncbi:MAG: aminotransferase class I/II-fold pyridoxal phosphate-dependent enzyme [Ilumatobacter sp.]|nr:aminotransferase class I/II-fold pyridoxal phosphate-dependent enzyme [Ilumatobacter sp.]
MVPPVASVSVNRASHRLSAIHPSATLAVDAKAKALKAAGENVIGFGAGEPDFPTPPHIVEAAQAACADPKNHKYSPAGGLPELKEAIAAKTMRDSGLECDPAQVLVTNGGKHAVYTAFAALCDPGDEVICPAPYWTTYPEAITLAGGVPVVIDTDVKSGFKVTIEQLDTAKTDRTKVLLFVSPDNPSGAVYTPAEVKAIGEWAVANGVWVITDEIYEHLTYGATEFSSMPVLVPDLAKQCLVVNGVAKTYAMTGWRVGWMIGPTDVIKPSTSFQSHATSNVANVSQRAALAAVSGPLDDVEMMREAFTRRGRLIHSMLNDIDGVVCPEPQGAFYAFPDLRGLIGRSYGGVTANSTLELADIVLDQAKVAWVPGEAFGTPGYGRFSFALGDADIESGIDRLAALVS